MFDTENDQKKISIEEPQLKAGSSQAVFKKKIIMLVSIAGALVLTLSVLIVLFLFRGSRMDVIDGGGIDSSEQDTGIWGLQNPGKLTDIETTTAEDLQEEFESRPGITEDDVVAFEQAIPKYLSYGDFEGLDNYLREQEATYKGPEGAEAEYVEDWSGKFPAMRSDAQNALNFIKKSVEPSASRYQVFSSPDILAAAVVWSPITMKIDAFLDYSALILPPPSQGANIKMQEYVYEKPHEKLAEILEMTGSQFLDVRAYDMTLEEHSIRVIVVMGPLGYWQPWSVQDLGGTINATVWTKSFLRNTIEPNINYRTNLDEVCFLSPPDALIDKAAHPEWFDEDGVYIGPAVGGYDEDSTIGQPPDLQPELPSDDNQIDQNTDLSSESTP